MNNNYTLVIPVTGLMSLYQPDAILLGGPRALVVHPVAVNLTRDEMPVAVAYVSRTDTEDRNIRAERAAYLLTGVYFRMHGTVVLDDLTEHRSLELMMEVANDAEPEHADAARAALRGDR